MNDKFFIALLIVTALCCRESHGQGRQPGTLPEKIDSVCKSFLEQSSIAGISIAITKGNDLLFAKGYGEANREKGVSATPRTMYPIASVSKLVTAVAIMTLVNRGILRLEDHVADILPDFPKRGHMERITVDQCLRHTSGLVDYGKWADSLYLNGGLAGNQDFIKFIDRPLLFEPGTSFSYSNSGFRILTMIIEKLSGQPFQDYILKAIAGPAEMPSLNGWQSNSTRAEATVNYEMHQDSLQRGSLLNMPLDSGDGGLSASVLDLVKLPRILVNGTLIPRVLLDTMLRETNFRDIRIHYGAGVRLGEVSGHRVWGHTGGGGGSTISKLAHFPKDDLSVAILVNTLYTSKGVLDLEEALLPVLLPLDKPKVLDSISNPLRYTGTFVTKDRWGAGQGSTRVISEKGGTLFRDNPGTETPAQQLYYLGDNTFRNEFYPFDHFKFHLVNGVPAALSEYANGMFIQVRLKEK